MVAGTVLCGPKAGHIKAYTRPMDDANIAIYNLIVEIDNPDPAAFAKTLARRQQSSTLLPPVHPCTNKKR